jgi:hypothetical protein
MLSLLISFLPQEAWILVLMAGGFFVIRGFRKTGFSLIGVVCLLVAIPSPFLAQRTSSQIRNSSDSSQRSNQFHLLCNKSITFLVMDLIKNLPGYRSRLLETAKIPHFLPWHDPCKLLNNDEQRKG